MGLSQLENPSTILFCMKTRHFTPKFTATLGLALLFTFGCSKEDLNPSENLSASSSQQASASAATSSSARLSSTNYIIIASGDKLPADIEARTKSANGKVTSHLSEAGIAAATSTDPNFAAKAAKIAGVRSVVRDFTFQGFDPEKEKVVEIEATYGNPPASGDNDRFFDLQWGHDAINAPEAWNAGYRGKGARVAVLDSGFDLDHADLAPNVDMAASANFVTGEKLGYALAGVGSHGTHTAGTIAAADNGIGIIGVAPESQLILVKVLRDSGSGSFSWMLDGIVHAVKQGADVINMSLGASIPRNGKYLNDNGTPNDPTDDFIESDTKATQELIVAISKVTTYAYRNGVTIIASAGNDAIDGNKDGNLVQMPADAPHVISISATAPRGWALNPFTANLDFLASYSNFGTSEIDFAAPGGDYQYQGNERATIAGITQPAYVFDYVFSAGSNLTPGVSSYYWSVGTSMAAPHAAGVAALIVGKNGGQMDPAKVEAVLRASSDDLGKPGRDPQYGHGRVNAFRAVSQAN